MAELELVAPIARGHNDPIVRAVADFVPLLYQRRRSLLAPFRDVDGALLMPAMGQLLARPAKRAQTDGQAVATATRRRFDRCNPVSRAPSEREAFDYRRADGMAVICRVLTALAAHCNWVTQEIHDPQSGYFGIKRIAADARCSIDQAERALYWLRAAKIVCFTKQFREQRPDGSFRAWGNALRKLAVNWFESIPSIKRIFEARRKKLKERAASASKSTARDGIAEPIIHAQETRPNPLKSVPPVALTDAIAAEHPDWDAPRIFDEARRRGRGPPSSS